MLARPQLLMRTVASPAVMASSSVRAFTADLMRGSAQSFCPICLAVSAE